MCVFTILALPAGLHLKLFKTIKIVFFSSSIKWLKVKFIFTPKHIHTCLQLYIFYIHIFSIYVKTNSFFVYCLILQFNEKHLQMPQNLQHFFFPTPPLTSNIYSVFFFTRRLIDFNSKIFICCKYLDGFWKIFSFFVDFWWKN